MSFDDIDRRRVEWCVVINGLPYRFCSSVAPGSSVLDGNLYDHADVLVQTPTDIVNAVVGIGPIEGHIDDMRPVADQSAVDVHIIARGARTAAGARIDPVETVMRVAGPPSSTRRVKLLSSVTHVPVQDGPVTINVGADVSAWTLPGVVHIGQEVIWADAAAGNGTPGNLYRFTGCTRGVDRWATQAHAVDAVRGEQPWITSDVVTWRGRRAAIYVSALDMSGAALGWVQYWQGLIDSAPTYDGRVMTLRIAPLTAAVEYKLGVGSAARTALTVAGAHRFRIGTADRLLAQAQIHVTRAQYYISAADGVAGTITLTVDGAARLDSFGHPLRVSFELESQSGGVVSAVAASYASPTLSFGGGATIAADAAADLAAGLFPYLHANGAYRESLPLRLVDPDDPGAPDVIVAWPGQLLAVINQAQAWQSPVDCWDAAGANKRQVRMRLADPGDRWALLCRLADNDDPPPPMYARVRIMRGGQACRAGWIFGETVDAVRGDRADTINSNTGAWLGEDITERDAWSNDPLMVEHEGPAVWYYQGGEPYVGPFDADIYTGGEQQIEVTGSGDTPVRMWISGVTSGTHPETGATVYWYAVHRPDRARHLVQMQGDRPLTAQVVAGAPDTSPGQYIARLLISGIGNGDNGAADVMPIGCNLPQAAPALAVWTSTFDRLSPPNALLRQDYEAVRGKSVAEQTGGLLMACGAQIAQVYDPAFSKWRIACVDMGPADAMRSAMSITDDDLRMQDGEDPVKVEVDGRTVRAYRVMLNYRSGSKPGEPEVVNVSAATETNAAGADSGSPLEIDLPGVEVEGVGGVALAAAEVVADIRSRVGVPRVRWSLTIRADATDALTLGLGDVVTLTSIYAIGIDPTTTADAAPCRIVGIKRDLIENTLELELRPFPASAAGWNQSARVASIPTADTLTIDAAAFSSDDASHFAVGDKVTIFAPGDWAARAAKTVTGVSGVTLTIVGHGASVDDIIRCDDYATATTAQKGRAFVADSDGNLGADPGYVLG